MNNNKNQKDIYAAGVDSNNEGWKALQNGDIDRAIALFRRSIELCQIIDDYEGVVTALANLAESLFKKWAKQRSVKINWDVELKDGLLIEGLECLSRAIDIRISNQDLKGAGGIVNDVYNRLSKNASLGDNDAISCFSFFKDKYLIPLMRKSNIRELPGLYGFPVVVLS